MMETYRTWIGTDCSFGLIFIRIKYRVGVFFADSGGEGGSIVVGGMVGGRGSMMVVFSTEEWMDGVLDAAVRDNC